MKNFRCFDDLKYVCHLILPGNARFAVPPSVVILILVLAWDIFYRPWGSASLTLVNSPRIFLSHDKRFMLHAYIWRSPKKMKNARQTRGSNIERASSKVDLVSLVPPEDKVCGVFCNHSMDNASARVQKVEASQTKCIRWMLGTPHATLS